MTELEIKVAHQERLLADLDDVVKVFTVRVEALERELKQVRESTGQLPIGEHNEPPPHY